MISYGLKSSSVNRMNGISFMANEPSDYENEVKQNQYYTIAENSDSTHSETFLKHHNNEEGTWLQDTAYCSESNHDTQMSTDQILHEIQLNTQPTYYHERSEPHRINRGIGKFHRASIFVTRTPEGNFKATVRRKRTVFTEKQLKALEEYFCRKQYVTRQERQKLVDKLKLDDKAVKIWFQNRRLKAKRDQELQETTDSETLEPYLDYIESQINEKTNELGYVTLDDTLTGNLVNIIDIVLANRNLIDLSSDESTTETENKPIYEPVSPPEELWPD